MSYLNVTEVESALSVAASAPYNGFTQLITLPNLTWEGRQCHAIKIASGSGHRRPCVFFLGGVHAREWGSADILINFIEQLEQAFASGTGLTFGSRTFSATNVRQIVDTLDIIVFPQANPDGRNYSMTVDAMWRKNRRTAAPNSAACPGVDINRNYDFLWDFPRYFDPTAGVVDSTDPCDAGFPDNGTYHGPVAFSEPETQNAKWIFDAFPHIGYFVDVHSYSEDILYTWGDDEDQSVDPSMNFTNPAFDGARGIRGDAYGEYIPPGDFATAISLANAIHDGIKAFRGADYTIKSAYNLYPTAGTAHDYAYSRHVVDPGKRKVISYTLEWGLEFQPPYIEMQNIIQEITSGLLAFASPFARAQDTQTADPGAAARARSPASSSTVPATLRASSSRLTSTLITTTTTTTVTIASTAARKPLPSSPTTPGSTVCASPSTPVTPIPTGHTPSPFTNHRHRSRPELQHRRLSRGRAPF